VHRRTFAPVREALERETASDAAAPAGPVA
jgi:hypothetical protein